MSTQQKEMLREAGQWLTKGLLSVVVFFLVRILNQIELNQADTMKMNIKIEVIETRMQRLENDVKEIQTDLKQMSKTRL